MSQYGQKLLACAILFFLSYHAVTLNTDSGLHIKGEDGEDGFYIPITMDTNLDHLQEAFSKINTSFVVKSLRLQDSDQPTNTPQGRIFSKKLLDTFQVLRQTSPDLTLCSNEIVLYLDFLKLKDLQGAVPGLHDIIIETKESDTFLRIKKGAYGYGLSPLESLELYNYTLDPQDTQTLLSILLENRNLCGKKKHQTDVNLKNCALNASSNTLKALAKELAHPSIWWCQIERALTLYPFQRYVDAYVSQQLAEMSSHPAYLIREDEYCLAQNACEHLNPSIWKIDLSGTLLNNEELLQLVTALQNKKHLKEISLTLPYWGSDAWRVVEWGFGQDWQNRKTLKEQAAYLLKWGSVISITAFPCMVKDGISYAWGNKSHEMLFKELASIPNLKRVELELQGHWHNPENIQEIMFHVRHEKKLPPLQLILHCP